MSPPPSIPQRVLAAMSGGVDSAVVAGLLREQGREVVGATLQLYDSGAAAGRKGACCAGRDIADARRAAETLGIPHYVIDRQQRFRDSVIADFADSYAAGETPVPCVRCNQGVKFTDLLGLALELGLDAMATGHYVRRLEGPEGPELHRAVDGARDQSWFLFATTRAQLGRLLFPLGEAPDKGWVRDQARRLGLNLADKPDSQDLCFVRGSYATLLETLRPDAMTPGPIVTRDGRVLGRHGGIGRYTVGQGKRLGEAATHGGARQVVVALDRDRAAVVVGPRDEGARSLRLREVNWLVDAPERRDCAVRLRAREEDRPASVGADGGEAWVELAHPALAAPGQACVFYDGSRVLGGGIIDRARDA